MRCLLDTHTLVWLAMDSPRLSARARSILIDAEQELFLSAASSFEIATKYRLGKLPEAEHLLHRFNEQLASSGITLLDVTSAHGLTAGSFPHPHKDPFDRIIAAQAQMERLVLLSADAQLDVFGVKRIW